MPGGINKLNTKRITAWIGKAKASKAPKKLSDGGGLYLTLTGANTPVWRIKYRLGGVERTYSPGPYEQIGLEAARAARSWVKRQLREGRDPVKARQLDRATATAASGDTFKEVAEQWLDKQRKKWSLIHYEKSSRALERDVYPRLGRLPVADITPAMVTAIIEAIVKRGTRDTAAKVRQHVEGVFRIAQAKDLCRDNPAGPAIEIIPDKSSQRRLPALLKFPELGGVLRGAEAASLSPAVRMAHRLCAFSVARISNVVQAEWSEFDLDSAVPTWTIPRRKMKARDRHHDHKIVLCQQITDELRKWAHNTGGKGYVFPSPQGGKHIGRESLEKVYRVTLGLRDKHSPHGWRSSFATLARDEGHDREVVELTLDHVHDNAVARSYDRGERLEKRIKLARWWGDQLSSAQRGAQVTPIRRKAGGRA